MDSIRVDYIRKRREFGRPVDHLTVTEPRVLAVLPPLLASKTQDFLQKTSQNLEVSCIPKQSEHEVNTERVISKNMGVLHMEGGWPKDIDPTEKDQTQRYRKKVEKDETYIKEVKAMGDAVESLIMQNRSIDIYEEYFKGEYADHSSEAPSAKTLSVFKDINETKRTVTDISWYPDGGKKLAVSFAIMQFQDYRCDKMSADSYIWDVQNPNKPEETLKPSSPLCCLEYNPKDSYLIVGGSYNGLVQVWDTRTGSAPKEQSIIEKSHRDPVYSIAWLSGKTATECASTSTDGQVLWWDIRKLGEPTDALMLEEKGGEAGRLMGGVSMEYSSVSGPTKFLVGTEQGKVISCNRKAKNPSDRLGLVYEGHCGPVYALQRNSFFPKYFLTIGDWTVRLWNEELRTPIMTSKYFKNYLLDAAWSPTRPGVFLTTKMDGTLDVWDYFYKQNDPTLSLQIDDDGLYTLKMQEQGSLVATGSVDGSVYLLELCDGLAQIQPNEKVSVQQARHRPPRPPTSNPTLPRPASPTSAPHPLPPPPRLTPTPPLLPSDARARVEAREEPGGEGEGAQAKGAARGRGVGGRRRRAGGRLGDAAEGGGGRLLGDGERERGEGGAKRRSGGRPGRPRRGLERGRRSRCGVKNLEVENSEPEPALDLDTGDDTPRSRICSVVLAGDVGGDLAVLLQPAPGHRAATRRLGAVLLHPLLHHPRAVGELVLEFGRIVRVAKVFAAIVREEDALLAVALPLDGLGHTVRPVLQQRLHLLGLRIRHRDSGSGADGSATASDGSDGAARQQRRRRGEVLVEAPSRLRWARLR